MQLNSLPDELWIYILMCLVTDEPAAAASQAVVERPSPDETAVLVRRAERKQEWYRTSLRSLGRMALSCRRMHTCLLYTSPSPRD